MRERLTWLVDSLDCTQCPPSSTPAQCFNVSRNQFLLTLITTANDKKTRFYHASCVPRVFLLWHDTKRSTSRWNAWAVPIGRVLSLVSQIMEQNAGLCLGQPVDITQRPLLLPSNHYLALHILCINSHTAYSKSSGDKMQSHNGCILMTWLQ